MKTWFEIHRAYLKDLAERVGATFAEVFLAIWGAPIVVEITNGGTIEGIWAHVVDASILEKAFIAGLASVLALLKGVWARYRGDRETASLVSSGA